MKKITILISFLLLVSCGFEPIHSSKKIKKNLNFSIQKISLSGETIINQTIKNKLKNYKKLENKKNNYDLKITNSGSRTTTSKNALGEAQTFSLDIKVILEVSHYGVIKNRINFKESFNYKNNTNKFNLKQYEDNIRKNLSTIIANDIISYLLSLQ